MKKIKVKSRTKAKPSAARDPMTGELIADRLVKLINTSVYIDWIDPKHDWHYFTVLDVTKTEVKLRGEFERDTGYPHKGDIFWAFIDEIKDVWRVPNALEGVEFKKTVMRLIEESIRTFDEYFTIGGNTWEKAYNDGFDSGLSRAKEELESLLNKVKVS